MEILYLIEKIWLYAVHIVGGYCIGRGIVHITYKGSYAFFHKICRFSKEKSMRLALIVLLLLLLAIAITLVILYVLYT